MIITKFSLINIQKNISLRPYNTFGIEAKAAFFVEINSTEELQAVLKDDGLSEWPLMILGGGSNVLLTKDFEGLVLKMNITGIKTRRETDDHVFVEAGAGENWHEFVLYCVKHNLGGVENLSLIPGTVGAAPMQNIGAYGTEIKDTFESLEAVEKATGQLRTFTNEECRFGYRESIFKKELKDQYIITSVVFRLNKVPVLNLKYGGVQEALADIESPTIDHVSKAITAIRQSKLPDPAQIGNSGSFFKNPEIPEAQFNKLKEKYPTIPGYPTAAGFIKVPAAWLIEQCGWKGKVMGQTGTYKNHALVLVNHGGATGAEVWQLAMDIQQSVQDRFGITIQPEVNIVL